MQSATRAELLRVWNPEVCAELGGILDRALAAARGKPEEKRVAFVRDGFAYTTNMHR